MLRLQTLRPPPFRLLLWLALMPLLLLAILLSSGCATSPASTASGTGTSTALQTFDTLYSDAESAVTVAVTTATTALQSGLINQVQATQVLKVTDAIQAVLTAANAAAQVGNSGTANANLAQAVAQIAILSSCLTAKPLTVATFASCTAKLAAPAVQT
jgi:hypothetical protein